MWYKVTDKYNSVSYKQGSWDIKEGLDCLSMIVLFMKDIGNNVDDWISGKKGFLYKDDLLTATNFLEYVSTQDETSEALMHFIKQQCVKVNKINKGDICLFKIKGGEPAVGIYLGQNTVMCCFIDYGIKKFKIRDSKIMEIYRWAQAQK